MATSIQETTCAQSVRPPNQPARTRQFAAGQLGGERVAHILRSRLVRVLVVDENQDAANTTAMLLGLWGHEAQVAYSGAAALDLIATFHPDVFLLDLGLRRMSGCELAQQLRGQSQFRKARLIAVAENADSAHRLLGEETGFELYLVKPVDPSVLKTLLLRLSIVPVAAAEGNGRACHIGCCRGMRQ